MKTALLLTGSGPLVIATSHSSLVDPTLLKELRAKGIEKFIAYELPSDLVQERYGGHFSVAIQDLHESDDLRVIDFNGERAFNLFRLRELGRRVLYERDDAGGATDDRLRQDVVDALDFDPSVDAANIRVAVKDGVVTLTGHVGSYIEKVQTEELVRRVKGVRAIAQELEVQLPGSEKTSDDEIARRALNLLTWDTTVPKDAIQVSVEDGWITLLGQVNWYFQKTAAETALHQLQGIRGIHNRLTLRPQPQVSGVQTRIENALRRAAALETDRIRVSVDGQKVVLEGEVRTWAERHAAETAAWTAPGVSEVEDRLTVVGST